MTGTDVSTKIYELQHLSTCNNGTVADVQASVVTEDDDDDSVWTILAVILLVLLAISLAAVYYMMYSAEKSDGKDLEMTGTTMTPNLSHGGENDSEFHEEWLGVRTPDPNAKSP